MTEPAFPGHTTEPNSNGGMCRIVFQEGMTLRDYFAAKAMQHFQWTVETQSNGKNIMDSWSAERCYMVADAMMEARK
mgnify:CR=1 FL=1